MTRDELDPWRVICNVLFELDSDEITEIIGKTGLRVDWTLDEKEKYSHKTRKRNYLPRINNSYGVLSDDDKLRVAFIVSMQLAHKGCKDKLDAGLSDIGWQIEGDRLSPKDETVRELFFQKGTQHDAYTQIKTLILNAERSLRLVDPYLDETIFNILSNIQGSLVVDLLTSKCPSDFEHEAKIFQRQHPNIQIEMRRSKDFHDRFIIIDETKCWHIGSSIKDAGNKGFMLSQIRDSNNIQSLLSALDEAWEKTEQTSTTP